MINMWNLISVTLDEKNSMLQKWKWCDKWMNCYSIAKFQSHTKSWQFDISVCVHTQSSAQQSICHFKTSMQMILNDYMICVALDERNSTSQKWSWDDNCVRTYSTAKIWFHTNFWRFSSKACELAQCLI